MTTRSAGRWQRRKADRPTEIVAAALDLFVERGFRATRLEDVALHAEVSKGTLYLYFRNKDALFRAVISEMVVPEIERAEQRARQHRGSQAVLLRELTLLWWQTVGESRLGGIPKLMVAEAHNFPDLARFFLEQAVRRVRRMFARVLRRGVENGEFRACSIAYTVRLLLAPLVFAAIYEHSLRPYDRDPYGARRFVREHVDLFLRGIAKPQTMRRSA